MKKMLSLIFVMLLVLSSFSSVYALERNFIPNTVLGNSRVIVENNSAVFSSWGYITTTHYYCNPEDKYGGIIGYIGSEGTARIEIFKVGSSTPLATHTVYGPYSTDIGDGINITVKTAGYYYVKVTNTSSSSLDIAYAVVHD